MAKPMTPDQLLKALRDEGLTVREYDGWERRCRCCPDTGPHKPNGPFIRGWGDVNGGVQHITGGGLGNRTVEQYIRDIILFDPSLLTKSQFVTDPDGVVWLVAAGRANHAGGVGSTVRSHLIAADYSLTDDYDDRFRGGTADGNAFTYGNEAIAATKMNAKQRASSVKLWAAIAKFHTWTGQEIVGHGEVSSARTKADPNLHMGDFRRDVMAAVTGGKPAPKPDPKPKPDPAAGPVVYSGSLNAGSYNRHGADTYKTRIDKYAKRRLSSDLDVLDLQEVGNGLGTKTKPNCRMRSRIDDQLGDVYRRHIGSDGRYCYSNRTRIKPIKSGVITAAKSTWFNGDDKQAAYLVYEKDSARAMDVSFHLENEDGAIADAKRVAQMLSILAQALVIAKAQGVDIRNILFVGDTNSEGMVAAAMLAAGWRNVGTGGKYENTPTFIGWDGKAKKRFDYGFVHTTAGPASINALHADPKIGDHAEIVIKRTLTK